MAAATLWLRNFRAPQSTMRITSAQGDLRDSAAENRPPALRAGKGETAVQETTRATGNRSRMASLIGSKAKQKAIELLALPSGRLLEPDGDVRSRWMAIHAFTA